MGDISKYINEEKKELMETKLTPQKICQLVELIESGEISNKIAKTLLPFLAKTDSFPQELVKEKGLTQLSDTKMITDWCQQVVDANPAEVQKYKSGKDKVFGKKGNNVFAILLLISPLSINSTNWQIF